MKFRVTKKDLTYFIIFSIILFYFCTIVVENVFLLLNGKGKFTFNPFDGLINHGFLCIFLFFIILIVIFASVKDSIFEHKKGFGFSIGEKSGDGYSRWLEEKEMKKAFKVFRVGVKDVSAEKAGVVFINDGKNMWVDDSENHTLVIGVTGSGKTTAVVDPLIYSLCKHGESMVITDPKGEIYKNHAELLKARGYKIIVLNFREPAKGNAWNPLSLPYQLYHEGNIDKATELIDDVSSNIIKDKSGNNDPFWQNSSSDYFSGCVLGLMEDAKEEEVNINTVSRMTTDGEDKMGPGSNYIKEYFNMKGTTSSAYTFASTTINSPNETKGGILATFRQKIRIFAGQKNLSEMLSYSDFDMKDIGRESTAVFMVIHDEKTTYHALATIFIKQCYETLIGVAHNEPNGALPHRTNFILDEFANMPALKDVTTMVTAARSRAIRFTFIIQNFAQLNEVYGEQDAQTIRSNCGNLIYLLTTELKALEEISKMCGEVKSKKDDKSESHPLVTVSDLQKLKPNEVIILRNRLNPFRTKLRAGFDVDWGDKEFGKAVFTERESHEIKTFDIKNFVDLRKKSKKDKDENPFAGGLGIGGGETRSAIPTFEEFMAARNKKNQEPEKSSKPAGPAFNIDELVKKIDAEIARLEEQEKNQNKVDVKNTNSLFEAKLNPINNVIDQIDVENDAQQTQKPVIDTINNGNNTQIQNPVKDVELEDIKPISPVTLADRNINTGVPPVSPSQIKVDDMEETFIHNPSPVSPNSISTGNLEETMIFNEPIVNKNNVSSNISFNDLINDNGGNAVVNDTPKTDEKININMDNESKVIDKVSDDAYFDDFFGE